MDIERSSPPRHPSRPLLLRGRPADRSVGSPGDLHSHRYAESGHGCGIYMDTCRGRPRFSTATGTRRRLGFGGLPAFQLVSCQLPASRRLEASRHVDSLRPISPCNTVRRLDACAIESRQPVDTAPSGRLLERPRAYPRMGWNHSCDIPSAIPNSYSTRRFASRVFQKIGVQADRSGNTCTGV